MFAEYEDLCRDVTTLGDYCDIMSVLALGAVIGEPIQSYIPPLTTAFTTQPLTRSIVGRSVSWSRRPAVTIMWSSSTVVPRTGPVHINHFVPLLHRPVGELDCVDVADELHDADTDDNTPATACVEEVVMSLSESPSDDDEAP